MQRHYDYIKSTKSSRRWASALIRKLWEVSWDQWDHRNEILKNSDDAERLHGMEEIDAEIRREMARGPGNLQQRHRYHFDIELERLLEKPPENRRAWLENVRAARNRKRRRDESSEFAHQRRIMKRFFRKKNDGNNTEEMDID